MKRALAFASLAALAACSPKPAVVAHAPRTAELVVMPAGQVQIGDDNAPPDERPAHQVKVRAFALDRTPVTVAQFAAFVADTHYVTDAERHGDGQVLDKRDGGWVPLKGANWRKPEGPTGPDAVPDHPVVQVSWRDADAFCRAYGGRLPTEEEWERAARRGQTADGHVFKAGDPISINGKWRANTWQGLFPLQDDQEDGYKTTSPVGAFGSAPSGLTDMAGNVWEWTSSWYAPYGAQGNGKTATERVQRGGSFLCDPGFCQGFRVTARGHSTPDTALMHVGFRCAAAPEAPAAFGKVRAAGVREAALTDSRRRPS